MSSSTLSLKDFQKDVLGYTFVNENLLINALLPEEQDFKGLKQCGNVVINLVVSTYIHETFKVYRFRDQVDELVAAVNSTENLAVVFFRKKLDLAFKSAEAHAKGSICSRLAKMASKIFKFENGPRENPPEFLADIVRSVVGAISVDLGHDDELPTNYFPPALESFLEPIITVEIERKVFGETTKLEKLVYSYDGKRDRSCDYQFRTIEVEEILGYVFKDKTLLFEAFVHSSRLAPAEDRNLESFGTSILSYAVFRKIYVANYGAEFRRVVVFFSSIMNHEAMVSKAVELGLDKHMSHNVPGLSAKIERYKNGKEAAPQALGGLIRAIIAAIFLDSNGKPPKNNFSNAIACGVRIFKPAGGWALGDFDINSLKMNRPMRKIVRVSEPDPNRHSSATTTTTTTTTSDCSVEVDLENDIFEMRVLHLAAAKCLELASTLSRSYPASVSARGVTTAGLTDSEQDENDVAGYNSKELNDIFMAVSSSEFQHISACTTSNEA
ncbi:hypothetical protein GIB67_032725 [Kingdonia uniflora]|uniref:RNase III domain-containing protein n=1 Tax=Kingdonia uniflora TaxID=39325 RepID=A0A7J7MWN6_9MAGN|nr:hypothetical protein GIB67_032725 [Kingdonia uniflora]